MENINYPFENLVIFGEYYFGRCDIYIYIYIYIYTYTQARPIHFG